MSVIFVFFLQMKSVIGAYVRAFELKVVLFLGIFVLLEDNKYAFTIGPSIPTYIFLMVSYFLTKKKHVIKQNVLILV